MSSQQPTTSFQYTKEKTNFVRLCMLLIDICTSVLRDVLRMHIPEHQFTKELKSKQYLLKLNSSQRKLVFPSSGTYCGTFSEFDIALLYTLLRNLCGGVLTHRMGWGNDPDPADTSIAANVERVRIFRNKLEHIPSTSVNDKTFGDIWSHVRQIVVELEQSLRPGHKSIQGAYRDAVDKLENVKLDTEQEERYIYFLKTQQNLTTEVEFVKETLKRKADREEVDDNSKRIQRLEDTNISRDDSSTNTVRQNILDRTNATLRKHANDDCYTATGMVQTVMDRLSNDHVIIISGKAGTGKTTLALEVMRRLSDPFWMHEHRIPAIIKEAEHWDSVVNCNDTMVVFLDDPVGKTNFDKTICEKWEKYFNCIMTCAEQGNVYVIVGIRNTMLKESQDTLEKYELFKSKNILDLSSKEYGLSTTEKYAMIEQYGTRNKRFLTDLDKCAVVNIDPYYGFPLTCHYFFSDAARFEIGVEFFKHSKPLYNEIDKLRSSGNEKMKYQYCILVYVLLNNSIDMNNIDMKLVHEIYKQVGISNPRRVDIEDAVNAITGVYLNSFDSSRDLYSFMHETVLENICVSFGRLEPAMVIQICSETVLREMIKPSYYRSKSDEVVLKIQSSHYYVLVDRLLATDPLDQSLERVTLIRLIDDVCNDPVFVPLDSCNDQEFDKILANLSDRVSPSFRFFIACRFGMFNIVHNMLACNGSTTDIKSSGIELSRSVIVHSLFQSVVHNHLTNVKEILQYDSKLAECGYCGTYKYISALHVAATKNYAELVQYLSSLNPDFKKTYDFLESRTLLHDCVDNNCKNTLDVILNVDPTLTNLKNRFGFPILYYAARMNKKDMATVIYKHKANVKDVDMYGKTFLHYCIDNDWADMLENVLNDEPEMASVSGGDSLIRYAAVLNKLSSIAVLNNYGKNQELLCQINTIQQFKQYVENDCYDELDALIKQDPSVVNLFCESLICYAASLGKRTMVCFLLSHQADVIRQDSFGYNLLHYCVAQGWDDLIDDLLKNNADIVVPTGGKRWLCIHIAAFFGRFSILKKFTGLGQNLTDVTNSRYDVLKCTMLALRYGPGAVLTEINQTYLDVTLTKHSIKISTTLGNEDEYHKIFEYIFKNNPDSVKNIDTPLDKYRSNILHYLVLFNCTTLFEQIVGYEKNIMFEHDVNHPRLRYIIHFATLLGRKHLFETIWKAGLRPIEEVPNLIEIAKQHVSRSGILIDPTELVVGVNATQVKYSCQDDYIHIIAFLEQQLT